VHKQDHRDRAIPAAVIVVVFVVAILVAALIWLAASWGGQLTRASAWSLSPRPLPLTTHAGRHFRPECQCGRGGTTGIAWPVRASCVLTAPPRRPTRDRARTARGTGPGARSSAGLPVAAGGASDSLPRRRQGQRLAQVLRRRRSCLVCGQPDRTWPGLPRASSASSARIRP